MINFFEEKTESSEHVNFFNLPEKQQHIFKEKEEEEELAHSISKRIIDKMKNVSGKCDSLHDHKNRDQDQ
jgi:uncharacterized membrane protein